MSWLAWDVWQFLGAIYNFELQKLSFPMMSLMHERDKLSVRLTFNLGVRSADRSVFFCITPELGRLLAAVCSCVVAGYKLSSL